MLFKFTGNGSRYPVNSTFPVRIVGLGGTTRPGSTSELALRIALSAAQQAGATTRIFSGTDLKLPIYEQGAAAGNEAAMRLIDAVRECDGLILSSPAYHGSVSGLVKNALDYIEELSGDDRPYLDGRGVGCIVCAYGWQAVGTTVAAMRSIVHALRGWPTPLAGAINSLETPFDEYGEMPNPKVGEALNIIGRQVVSFAQATAALKNQEKVA